MERAAIHGHARDIRNKISTQVSGIMGNVREKGFSITQGSSAILNSCLLTNVNVDSGASYKGDWLQDKKHGNGVITFDNGTATTSRFENDVKLDKTEDTLFNEFLFDLSHIASDEESEKEVCCTSFKSMF